MQFNAPNISTDDILAAARKLNYRESVIANSPSGQEIVCFQMGGDKEPAILITAGAHGDEPSGPLGAVELLSKLKTNYKVFVVPLRDPFGWNGYDYCLSHALGKKVSLENHDHAEELLREVGNPILDIENLLITEIGDFFFAFKRPAPDTVGPREIWQHIGKEMPERLEITSKLQGKRIILPSNLDGVEGCNNFDRAYTVLLTPSGIPGNLNRFFGIENQPPETAAIQGLIEKIKPGMTLDLHEGQGSDFYVFVAGNFDEMTRTVTKAMIDGVIDAGHNVTSLSKLAPQLSPEILAKLVDGGPGILSGELGGSDAGVSCGGYGSKFGVGLTTETGRWTSLSTRVSQQVTAVEAAVSSYEIQNS